MIADLNEAASSAAGRGDSLERHEKLKSILPPVSIVAICGLPVIGGKWMGMAEEEINTHLVNALGLGSVLTFLNPKGRTLGDFGNMAISQDEMWHANTIWISLCFSGWPREVRDAFSFDRRFVMSWCGNVDSSHPIFMASGSLKDWIKFLNHAEDKSFKPTVREAMSAGKEAFQIIWPMP